MIVQELVDFHIKHLNIDYNFSKQVSFLEIETDKGHDSFLLNEMDFIKTVSGFLNANFLTNN